MRKSRLDVFLCAILVVFGELLAFGPATAQNSKPAGRETQLQIQLPNAVKARKAKAGDSVSAITVTAVTQPAGIAVPAGSKVLGHVRKVEADLGAEHNSLIALSFDEIYLKKGQTVPLKSFIFAAMMPHLKTNYEQLNNQYGSSMPPISTGNMAGINSRGGPVATNGADALGAQTRGDVSPQPTSDSQATTVRNGQVANMPGVELAINESEHISTFKSSHKNLQLDEGLQLMLVVQR